MTQTITHDPSIALAADYSDALMTARRAKNLLVALLILMLVGQLALFFTAKYSNIIPVDPNPTAVAAGQGVNAAMGANMGTNMGTNAGAAATPTTEVATTGTATSGATAAGEPSAGFTVNNGGFSADVAAGQPYAHGKAIEILQYLVALTEFLGVTLSVVLAVVILLLVMMMLVGRLVGVSRVVSAFIWSIVLIVLLFPWQAFLADAHFASDFKIPGVLYTWGELYRFAKLGVHGSVPVELMILHWGRFVAFPVLTLIIAFMVHVKTNRGLREALGEVDAVMAVPTV